MRVTNEQLNYNGAEMEMERYPDGYMGKIQYWTMKLNDEVMNTKHPSLDLIDRYHRKLDYFIGKQWDKSHPQSQQEFTAYE